MRPSPTALLLSACLLACQSAAPASEPLPNPTTRIELSDRPQSSLAALVRILEAVDALRDPAAEIRLRALECDSLPPQRHKPARVRVVLDLTVYAEDQGTAERVEEALLAGLREGNDAVIEERRVDAHAAFHSTASANLTGFDVFKHHQIFAEFRLLDPSGK